MNDRDLSSSIKRDRQLNNLLFTQDVEVEYNGNNDPGPLEISGYEYLKNAFDNSVCEEVEIKIYDDDFNPSVLYYTGTIKIPNINLNLQTARLKTKIQDNSFYSYINNNKNLKVNFAATTTKNGEPLTPLQKWSVDMFNQSNCVYGSTLTPAALYNLYDAREVIAFIISAISDNKISFESDFLDSLDPKPFICKGQNLFNSYTIYPNAQDPVIEMSFQDIISEFILFYNVFFWIDNTDQNNPILKLENAASSYANETVYTFSDIKDLETTIDSNSLYSKVSVGNNIVNTGLFDSGLSYFGFKTEEFFPNGQCNTDNPLELINQFVVDTNSVQDILINSSMDTIDEIFVIECTITDPVLFTAEAYQWQLNNDGNCWYNIGLNNNNKIQRHSEKFTSTFGNFLGNGSINSITNGFKASLGSLQAYSSTGAFGTGLTPTYGTPFLPNFPPLNINTFQFVFSNETTGGNYDNGGNYNSGTGVYTAPLSGNYNFTFNADFTNTIQMPLGVDLNSFWVNLRIMRYDAANNLIGQVNSNTQQNNASVLFNGNFIKTVTLNSYADATDYFICEVDIAYLYYTVTLYIDGITFNTNTFFTCTGTPATSNNGGNGLTGNNSSKKYFYDFEYEIPQNDYINLVNRLNKSIAFEKDGITRYGWIESIKRNDWTGISQIKLITSNAATSQ
jgi:hypothetical protein